MESPTFTGLANSDKDRTRTERIRIELKMLDPDSVRAEINAYTKHSFQFQYMDGCGEPIGW